jgi:hypothetical protein
VHRRQLEEGCAFLSHCWNEGSKLPTLNNFPECSDKYTEYRQDMVIVDPSMKELEGYILLMVGAKK